jgi:hypothetical protein
MEDDAYPDWLWGLVYEGKKSATTAGEGDAVDLSCKLHRALTQDLPGCPRTNSFHTHSDPIPSRRSH